MKKITAIIAALMFLVYTVPAFADLQISNNNTREGQYRKVNFTNSSGLAVAANGDISGTAGNPVYNTVTTTGPAVFNTSLYADGETQTSSVLFSSSTSLGTGNMSFSDIFKTIGGSADATALHNGAANGQISRFHVLNPAIPTGGSWVLTPDTSLNINSFTMATARSEMTLVYVNSLLGWQPMGACNAVTIAYKSVAQ